MDRELAAHRAAIARASKDARVTGDTAKVAEMRDAYVAAKVEAAVRAAIKHAPPLSAAQKARITALLA